MPMEIIVVPNEAKISAMTMTSRGMVRVWLRGLGREVMGVAVLRSPGGTGQMRASWGERHRSASPVHATHVVFNRAPYAKYVFLGTTGPITSTRKRSFNPKYPAYMTVGASRWGKYSPYVRYKVSVRGITGSKINNVPMKAFRAVKASRGL